MTWIPWVLSGLSLLVALVSLVRTFVVAGRDESVKLHDELGRIKERVSLIEMKLGVFWRMVEENLSGILKKPIHLRMDMLLDKLAAHTLTLDECYELREQLRENYLEKPVDEDSPGPDKLLMPIAILVTGAVESLIHELERQPVKDCSL